MKVTPQNQTGNANATTDTGGGQALADGGGGGIGFPTSVDDLTKVLRGGAQLANQLVGDFAGAAAGVAAAAPAATPYAGPEIIGKFQMQRFHENLEKYSKSDQDMIIEAMGNASSPEEMAYVMKAVASGHKFETVLAFAVQIHNKSPEWLHKNLRLTGDGADEPGLKQQWNCSCAPTAAEVIRGEMDPIYALTVHRKNQDVTKDDPRTSVNDSIDAHVNGKKVGNHDVADDQREILENNGGDATERKNGGGAGMGLEAALNSETRWTGVTYEEHGVQGPGLRPTLPPVYQKANDEAQDRNLREVFAKADADLANGIPVGIRITSNGSNGGHAVAITGVTGTGADKTYILHDPWDGKTVYVKARDLERGNVKPAVAGWNQVSHVYTSKQDD